MNVLRTIFKVILGNLATVISGVFVGFLLPKIISVSDYGFYKIFTLYLNYVGVLSLGIIDGIVLKYGDKNYDELDRQKFRGFFAWYVVINAFFSVIVLAVACFISDIDYKFVIFMLGANLLPSNLTGYFQQISQITQRFKEFSNRKILQSAANVCILLVLSIAYKYNWFGVSYRIYLLALLALNVVLGVWYIFTYRDIVFGSRIKMRETFTETASLAKIGIPLLLANLCTTLILSLDRQFVSVLFTTEEYATYAFAYSMFSLITVATSAIATVVYPLFKRMDIERLKENYHKLNGLILAFVFLVILVFYPLCYFIEWFLPQYAESLEIFKIILPSLAVNASITVIMHNYYKVLDKTKLFFYKSIIALAVSFVANVIAYAVFGTREAISIASIISMLVWYVLTEMTINKSCGKSYKNSCYIFLMIAVFYLCARIEPLWLGMIINLIAFVAIIISFYLSDIKKVWRSLSIRRKKGDYDGE